MNFRLSHALKELLRKSIWAVVISLFLGGVFWMAGAIYVSPPVFALNYNNRILEGADFAGQDLTDSSFDHANLRKSDFSNSNVRGVRFFSANLSRTNFTSADLRYADLESVRLTNANLTNAILEGAFCTNTMFDGTIIDGADFTDVYLRNAVQKKLCEVAKGTNPTTGRETRDTLMCP
ncbi:MAG: pentapeptide repeat-containing protein [Calothrix sp. MO_192.B10]|nr:pentapeptide repeat-containing protein [Calothrix sp. MO_192.B10]